MQLKQDKYYYLNKTPFGTSKKREMTISTKLILQAADNLEIKWITIPGTELIELTLGSHKEHFTTQLSGHTSALAVMMTRNKDATKNLLNHHGLHTPTGAVITKNSTKEYKEKLYQHFTKPLVIKPQSGTHGDNVHIGISSLSQFNNKLDLVLAKSSSVVVEEMIEGDEYRLVATRDKLIAVTHRVPANVMGDSKHSIQELIDIKNSDKQRGSNWKNHALLKITLDNESHNLLNKQGFGSLTDIPKKNKQVFLRQTSNMSTGGDSIDYTDQAHKSVADIAIKAIRAIPGLAYAGIDFITKDITKPQTKNGYAIIEINFTPGIFFQYLPYEGKSRPTPQEFLYVLFPELVQS